MLIQTLWLEKTHQAFDLHDPLAVIIFQSAWHKETAIPQAPQILDNSQVFYL